MDGCNSLRRAKAGSFIPTFRSCCCRENKERSVDEDEKKRGGVTEKR